MTIAANDTIYKGDSQAQVDDGSTSTIVNNAYSVLADISAWTNTLDLPFADFVLKCQFDTTMPTVGIIDLYGRPMNLQSTNDPNEPDDNFPFKSLGAFPIDFGVANDVDFYTFLEDVKLPYFQTAQIWEFYLKNNGSGQTIGASWGLWITAHTFGPKA